MTLAALAVLLPLVRAACPTGLSECPGCESQEAADKPCPAFVESVHTKNTQNSPLHVLNACWRRDRCMNALITCLLLYNGGATCSGVEASCPGECTSCCIPDPCGCKLKVVATLPALSRTGSTIDRPALPRPGGARPLVVEQLERGAPFYFASFQPQASPTSAVAATAFTVAAAAFTVAATAFTVASATAAAVAAAAIAIAAAAIAVAAAAVAAAAITPAPVAAAAIAVAATALTTVSSRQSATLLAAAVAAAAIASAFVATATLTTTPTPTLASAPSANPSGCPRSPRAASAASARRNLAAGGRDLSGLGRLNGVLRGWP